MIRKTWAVKFIGEPPLPRLWGKTKDEVNQFAGMSKNEYQTVKLQAIEDDGWTIFTVLPVGSTTRLGGDNYYLKVICYR